MFMYERTMEWRGGDVPVSEPECGFDGEKCRIKFGERCLCTKRTGWPNKLSYYRITDKSH